VAGGLTVGAGGVGDGMRQELWWLMLAMGTSGAAAAAQAVPNEGPRAAQCSALSAQVSALARKDISRSYGPRYFIDLPRSQDRYNGITVLCPADADDSVDQIEFYASSQTAMDQMIRLVATVGAGYTRETPERAQQAAVACMAKARRSGDGETVSAGKLAIGCRTSVTGEELSVRKRP
jgi:hypothetical protein